MPVMPRAGRRQVALLAISAGWGSAGGDEAR